MSVLDLKAIMISYTVYLFLCKVANISSFSAGEKEEKPQQSNKKKGEKKMSIKEEA